MAADKVVETGAGALRVSGLGRDVAAVAGWPSSAERAVAYNRNVTVPTSAGQASFIVGWTFAEGRSSILRRNENGGGCVASGFGQLRWISRSTSWALWPLAGRARYP